jgi:hypothetical protein
MATYTKTVDPNGGADYLSIALWEAGEQALYSSGDIAIADCKRTGAAKDTTAVEITGWTSGVIPRVIVNTAHRHEGKWADTRVSDGNYIYHLSVSSNDIVLRFTESQNLSAEFDGLSVSFASDSTAGYKYIALFQNMGDTAIKNCLFKNLATRGNRRGVGVTAYRDNNLFYNNIIMGPFDGYGISSVNTDSGYYNNTVYDSVIGIQSSSGAPIFKNNISLNNSTSDYSISVGTSDYNVSSDATATGTTVATLKTDYATYFVDHTTGDFHLTDSSATLFGISSEDLSSTFTYDIDGDTRPSDSTFGLGADYYVSTAGGVTLSADSGSYSYTGTPSTLAASKVMAANSGSYTYTGTNAGLLHGFSLSANSGAYTYSGTNGDLYKSSKLTSDQGSYTYSGTSAGILFGSHLGADSGAYSYSGTAASLTFANAGNFTIAANAGNYTYSGTNSDLLASLLLGADSGTYTYSGTPSAIFKGFWIVAGSGSYTYTGSPVDFSSNKVLSANNGAYVYNGNVAALTFTPIAPDVPIAVGVAVSGVFGNEVAYNATFGNGVSITSSFRQRQNG